jgi:transposase
MDMIEINLHKRESQLCTLVPDGSIVEQRIATSGCSPARILLEASSESEWVAQCLEALRREVVVADPNSAPMYATRSRRVKTDKRDARILAETLRLGTYRPAHRGKAAR